MRALLRFHAAIFRRRRSPRLAVAGGLALALLAVGGPGSAEDPLARALAEQQQRVAASPGGDTQTSEVTATDAVVPRWSASVCVGAGTALTATPEKRMRGASEPAASATVIPSRARTTRSRNAVNDVAGEYARDSTLR